MDKKKIYNLTQIEVACIIGSPIAAGILIYLNYKNFEKKSKGISWIFIGIIWTISVIGLTMLISEHYAKSIGMVVPMINGLILYPIITKLQGNRIREHFKNNGEKGSNWLVAGSIILVLALLLTLSIILNRI